MNRAGLHLLAALSSCVSLWAATPDALRQQAAKIIRSADDSRLAGRVTDAQAALSALLPQLQASAAHADLAVSACVQKGLCAAALNDWPAAAVAFEQALKLSPPAYTQQILFEQSKAALACGQFTAARQAIDAMQPASPSQQCQRWQAEAHYRHTTGSYFAAAQAWQQALQDAPAESAGSLHASLAVSLWRAGSLQAAQEVYTTALAELAKAPPVHLAQAQVSAAALLLQIDQPSAALELLRPAITTLESSMGKTSPLLLAPLCTLGAALHLSSEAGAKMELMHQAELSLRQAWSLAERLLPPQHATRRQIASNLAWLLTDLQRGAEARPFAQAAADSSLALLPQVLRTATEADRLSFQRQADPLPLLMVMQPRDVPAIAKAIHATHGAVLQSLLNDARQMAVADEATRQSIITAKQRLAAAALTDAADLSTLQADLRAALVHLPHTPPPAVHTSQPQITYTAYRAYAGWGTFRDRLLALIEQPDQEPQLLDLGRLDTIQRQLRILLETQTDSAAAEALQHLRTLLWAPVIKSLPKETALLQICLDPTLTATPFAAWAADLPSTTVIFTTSPQALAQPAPMQPKGTWLAVDAAFPSNVQIHQQATFPYDIHAAGQTLSALPGASHEVSKLCSSHQPWERLTAPTEVQLRARLAAQCPTVLHIAGHALSSTEDASTTAASQLLEGADQPRALWRSSLLLPSAGSVFTAATPPSLAEDGWLFAAEVATFNLSQTQLVTLSACNTGIGPMAASEGVFGLARACHTAGARDVLLSTSRLPDQVTAELMADLYAHLTQGTDPAAALWAYQHDHWQTSVQQHGLTATLAALGSLRILRSR